ncbi:unnamed protein product [Symbiodinium natans]|uniref:Uncharacterized protein n=1 Tax=Symbiodinium natans TaxID=878477 RepID=A0A812RRI6_9DINO|nr:unnamed protein product [Symbiodinium natans]
MAQRTPSYVPPPGAEPAVIGCGACGGPGAAGMAYAAPQSGQSVPQLQTPPPPAVQLPGFSPPVLNQPQLQAQSFNASQQPGSCGALVPGAGLPSPEVIQKQKEGYIRLLDEQLKQGQNTLEQQRKQQSEYLRTQAQQQKQQVDMQIKQQVQQQEMQLLQQYNQSLMQVQQASAQQKSALETQAMQLVMEYQQKRSQEEMLAKQQQLQREHIEDRVSVTLIARGSSGFQCRVKYAVRESENGGPNRPNVKPKTGRLQSESARLYSKNRTQPDTGHNMTLARRLRQLCSQS